MKKLLTPLIILLALVASPSVRAQTCNALDAAALMASTTSLPNVADKPNDTDDLLSQFFLKTINVIAYIIL